MAKVTLRKKTISGGRFSLYLDFYPPYLDPATGKESRRKFLGMYVYPKKTNNPFQQEHNKETMKLAKQIVLKYYSEANKPEIYSDEEKKKLKEKLQAQIDFLSYFTDISLTKKGNNQKIWSTSLDYLKGFSGGKLLFGDLNLKFCESYRDYLLTCKSKRSNDKKLANNTALSYFNKFKATLKQAFKDEILKEDLNGRVDRIPEAETQRNFLTLDELNSLVQTECDIPILKQAALFSALTGLRFIDIWKLVWGEVLLITDNEHSLQFKQKKTNGTEVLPISEQAISLLGVRGEEDQAVFDGLLYSAANNEVLYRWIKNAGIKRKITFHCFRHTYATLLINDGVDIYTVSKMLGHRSVKTTQVYAKIVDAKKREAANKIKINL